MKEKGKKFASISIAFIMIAAIVLAALPVFAAESNLLEDSTFTSIDKWDTSPSNFDVSHAPDFSHTSDGSGSMLLDYSSPRQDSAWVMSAYYRGLPVEVGKTYDFSFWYFAEEGTPSISADYCDGTRFSSARTEGDNSIKNEWTKFSYIFTVEDATDACVRVLTTEAKESGKIWIDDVSLTVKENDSDETIDDVADKSMIPNGSLKTEREQTLLIGKKSQIRRGFLLKMPLALILTNII